MPKRYQSLADFLEKTETTQADFAARVGVKQAAISRFVHGARTPSLPLALRIAEAANIPVESLLTSGTEAA
jgi:transcriptional regulator with XRE-family HTH domain